MSATGKFDPNSPFDALPALPPAAQIETAAVLRQTVASARALAELKGSGGLIPDQSILVNAIPLQEAKLSSEIENIVTTQDELFRASLEDAVKGSPPVLYLSRYLIQRKPEYYRRLREIAGSRSSSRPASRSARRHRSTCRSSNASAFWSRNAGGERFSTSIRRWSRS